MQEFNKSPLEQLAEIARKQNLPVKIKPKSRYRVITPTIEDVETRDTAEVYTSITNFHFNFHIDENTVDKMIESSKIALKSMAAAGAAMLGTALLVGNRTPDKVTMPLTPKATIPLIPNPTLKLQQPK